MLAYYFVLLSIQITSICFGIYGLGMSIKTGLVVRKNYQFAQILILALALTTASLALCRTYYMIDFQKQELLQEPFLISGALVCLSFLNYLFSLLAMISLLTIIKDFTNWLNPKRIAALKIVTQAGYEKNV